MYHKVLIVVIPDENDVANKTMIDVLGPNTLGTKWIRTSICNVLENHDQNIEFRFRLLKVCLFVKLESSDCRIYWTKSARLDRSKIRLDRLNLVQIYFFAKFPIQPKPIWHVGFMFYSKYKRKNPSYILEVFDVLCVEYLVRSRGVYLHIHLKLLRSRFMPRTW